MPAEESTQADAVPEEPTEPDAEAEAAPVPEPPLVQERPREFTARTGMVLYFVRADGETAYEETMARVAEALAVSESEEREQQAEGWSTYKAEEPLADGVRLYVSWLDPAVPGADYWVPGILNEAFPTEAQTLYETYAGSLRGTGRSCSTWSRSRGPESGRRCEPGDSLGRTRQAAIK